MSNAIANDLLDKIYEKILEYQFHNGTPPKYIVLGDNLIKAIDLDCWQIVPRIEKTTIFGIPFHTVNTDNFVGFGEILEGK